MPSSLHEALVSFFRARPLLADALLLVPAEVTHLQVGDEAESILL